MAGAAWLLALAGAGLCAQTVAAGPAGGTRAVPTVPPPRADASAAARLAADIREEVLALRVTVADAQGRRETLDVPLTLYRPPGEGAFPLAVLAHGRSVEKRAMLRRARFEWLARYLVGKGFAVLVPTRAGYGDSAGLFDPEHTGACQNRRFDPMAAAAADQLLAALDHAARQPWADASRWIVVGQSVGGVAAMAVAARAPQGLKAAVNFAGGAGGDARGRPGKPCSPHLLQQLWREQAGTTQIAALWIYWTHDLFWGESLPRDWAQAWRDGGGRVEFHHLPPWSSEPADGHMGYAQDMDHALPLLEEHLARAGFTQPGLPQRPPPSGWARLDEVDKLPLRNDSARRQALERLAATRRRPRALAIGAGGRYGWAGGDWAIGRALGYCAAAEGQPCKLYAVDDDVVWQP